MELMTSLLFCALVAHFPQASATTEIKDKPTFDVYKKIDSKQNELKFYNTMRINENVQDEKDLYDKNSRISVLRKSTDTTCNKCLTCMKRAIKEHKQYVYLFKHRQPINDTRAVILKNKTLPKYLKKREIKPIKSTTDTQSNKTSNKQQSKTVSITKYNTDGKLYGLKVREAIYKGNDTLNEVKLCWVYSINKTFKCSSPEAHSFLAAAKKKKNMKENVDSAIKENKITGFTSHKFPILPLSRKRQVDHSQVPENFMPSIEENMY